MSDNPPLHRLVICVDGASEQANDTNIARIARAVKEGVCRASDDTPVEQTLVYTRAAKESTVHGREIENQIEFLTRTVSEILQSPKDELFLYGSGVGAYVVRAVAGVLHHMGLAKAWSMVCFHENYLSALDLYKAKREEDSTKGAKIIKTLKAQCHDPPIIKFVGVFDTVKGKADTSSYDVSFNETIRTFRHAMALNEDTVDVTNISGSHDECKRSSLQAWFVGDNDDLCGGVQQDGLSLYPLQWILIESLKVGLVLRPSAASDSDENPLILTFPQHAGAIPTIGNNEQIEWRSRYTNGIEVTMFDIQPTHAMDRTKSRTSHAVHLRRDVSFYSHPRKTFDTKGLSGWSPDGIMCTIIHPSVYCLLDRHPKLQANTRLKSIKKELADFQEYCMESTTGVLPPWLEDMQLSANGVKAFRILVCGKTGVGKSTLINKMFGVEATEESNTYSQGVHDINKAFESPRHPGLLIHDSRGWQAGSNQELELIAQFLRSRAFRKDPAEALHVIWFCVDSDVSRIEEADRKTFEIITRYSHHVPIFIIGTKKDKISRIRKMQLLEKHLNSDILTDVKSLNEIVTQETEKHVKTHFSNLISQFSKITHYRADASLCLSKDDDDAIKELLNQTIGLIADDRVRLFCVAAQVMSVDQKIGAAISETIRLGTYAIRSAILPLPFSGIIATPTVSRMICESVLQCFGFPKATPEAVDEIMMRIVVDNMKPFLAVAMTQFIISAGIGGLIFGAPPTARMLLKCACDMILILERSFRYGGKFVSVKQIEDAARYYTKATVKTFSGRDQLLQQRVHEAIDKMVPMTAGQVSWKFSKLRFKVEQLIYDNRFEKPSPAGRAELSATGPQVLELDGKEIPAELSVERASIAELDGNTTTLLTATDSFRSIDTISSSLAFKSAESGYVTSDNSPSVSDDVRLTSTSKEMEVKPLPPVPRDAKGDDAKGDTPPSRWRKFSIRKSKPVV